MPAPIAATDAEGVRERVNCDQNGIAVPLPASHVPGEVEQQVREYHDLKRRYPAPRLEDILADSQWASEMRSSEAFRTFAGQYLAIADRIVHGSGGTDIEARVNAAKAHPAHPERFWVEYVEPETWG